MLSDAWFDAVQAVFDAAAPSPNGPLILDQHFSDRAEDGYRVVLGDAPTITPLRDLAADAAAPDASFTQSFESAQRIARGEADAHQAFLLGDIGFSGDASAVIAHRASLDWLAAAMATLHLS